MYNQIKNRFLISSKRFNDLQALYESKKDKIYDIPQVATKAKNKNVGILYTEMFTFLRIFS